MRWYPISWPLGQFLCIRQSWRNHTLTISSTAPPYPPSPWLSSHNLYWLSQHSLYLRPPLPPGSQSHDVVAYLHVDSGHLQPLLVQWERVLHGVNCKELCTLHFHKYSVFLFNFWFFPETKYNNIKQQIKTCLFFALIKGILNVDSSLCHGDKGFYMVVNVLSP